ncbi:MAG: DNA polymerase Y family protein [Candidatus Saccharibacteria bacterium]|nr:DNA polymerase Y family protein [Candidatus Saccharibacteria bacterium]
MSVASSRLWLAIRFSDLPLTALKLDDAVEKPIVVIEKKRVIFANALAEDAGAQVGMDITTAQLLSGCEVVQRDEAKEQSALSALSEQFYHFSPYIDRFCSDRLAHSGLLLEISSCLKLFGGLKALSERVFTHLAQTPYGFEYGLAHSAKAAWYLSFDYHEIVGNETKSLFIERLNKLPIDLLFDYPKAVDALSKTGFKTFGDLARQIEGKSISSFKKRLGAAFTDVLCEIYDIDQNFQQSSLFEKPRDIYRPIEWFEEEIQFDYPVTNVAQLKPAFESLLQELSSYLRKRQQQCQYVEWCISDIYRKKEFVKVNSDEPQSHWQLLYDLSLIQFDNKELPFEVDTVKLTCHHVMPLQTKSQVLDFDQNRRRKSVHDFTITIAKLKARLGDSAVYKLGYRDSRVPEITNAMVALADRCNQELPEIHLKALRPTWLLTQPELIDVKGNRLHWHGYLTTLVGPERVIGEWWEKPVARDYFLAKRHDSLPVWIFFDLYDKQWYIHGVFA